MPRDLKTIRRSREDWTRQMTEYEAEGATRRAFCERHGLAYSSFCYWRKRLRNPESQNCHPVPLIELPVLPTGGAGWLAG